MSKIYCCLSALAVYHMVEEWKYIGTIELLENTKTYKINVRS
jgi:hypothetical protein